MKQCFKKEEDFINFIHDLKIPTAAQVCALEALLKTTGQKFSNDETDLIKLTLNSCNYTRKLLDMFLAVFKLKSQKHALKYEVFNIVDILNEVLDEHLILLKYSELNFEKIYKDKILINADKTYIKAAIENFLLNSIKMANKNTILKIKIIQYANKVTFEVENKSHYINEEILNKMYNSQRRYSKTSVDLSGFYLAREIINAHFGSIIVKSCDNTNALGFCLPT